MNAALTNNVSVCTRARTRLLSQRGEPLFMAAWERVLMIHFEVDGEALQRDVPYQLDFREGRAFVSLVAFTMRGLRPRVGGRLAALLFQPVATHQFLNVRTYVRHGNEAGIHFLAEWLSNRLAVLLGPRTFGLPYRYGKIHYCHDWQHNDLSGRVRDVATGATLAYEGHGDGPDALQSRRIGDRAPNFVSCEAGSLDEWLMERYTAFNAAGRRMRFFRVWHPPWLQRPVEVKLRDISLLDQNWRWLRDARPVGANFSPGFEEVWMGRPHRIKSRCIVASGVVGF